MTPELEFLMYPNFFYKNIFMAQLELQPSKPAKKAPKTTWVCFHSCSSTLAMVIQLWTPMYRFFYKTIFRPGLLFSRREQPKPPPKAPGFASVAAAVLWQQYFNCGPPTAADLEILGKLVHRTVRCTHPTDPL